jgi:hypothetical protein
MALANEDMVQIGAYVKDHMAEWLSEKSLAKPPVVYEIELRERMIRLEEELKHQRELMQTGFKMMEQRFEQVDKRFEQVDKRFEENRADMNKRFEQVHIELKDMNQRMDRFMIWSFGALLAVGGFVLSVLKLTG